MSPESKHPEAPRTPEFTIEYISAEDFFEQVATRLDEMNVSEQLEVPLGSLLASGFGHSPIEPDPNRTELWAYSLDTIAENLETSVDTPLSYIREDAPRPAVGVYDPRQFERTESDAISTHWRHKDGRPVQEALVAVFYPAE